MAAAMLVSGVLAVAQVSPMYPPPIMPGSAPVTMPGTVILPGYTVGAVPYGTQPYGTQPYGTVPSMSPITSVYPGMTTSDVALLNELRALRGDVTSMGTIAQGQMLTNRLNQLMATEQLFRQALSANPDLPNAHLIALYLNMEAQGLNRDIAAFTRALSMIPTEQRPFMAAALNSFDIVYWQPTIQALNAYQAQLPNAVSSYQPAFAANPWLQTWFSGYQTALAPLVQAPQVFASVRWWNQPVVLGSIEAYPGNMGSTTVLPNGAVIFIPANVAAGTATMPPMDTTATTTMY